MDNVHDMKKKKAAKEFKDRRQVGAALLATK